MESLYDLPFKILEVPNLRLKRPSWLKKPSAMFMYVIVTISYFLVTGGKYKNFMCLYSILVHLLSQIHYLLLFRYHL